MCSRRKSLYVRSRKPRTARGAAALAKLAATFIFVMEQIVARMTIKPTAAPKNNRPDRAAKLRADKLRASESPAAEADRNDGSHSTRVRVRSIIWPASFASGQNGIVPNIYGFGAFPAQYTTF